MLWCFCFKQKTAYEMRISDWSSDVCSSDLVEMEVKQLANSQVLKSTTLTDGSTAVGLGTLTLTTSSGSYDITIDSGNNTLDGLAEAINAADAGVTATIITDSDGARLVLKGGDGEDDAFTLTNGGGAAANLARFTWNGATGGTTGRTAGREEA